MSVVVATRFRFELTARPGNEYSIGLPHSAGNTKRAYFPFESRIKLMNFIIRYGRWVHSNGCCQCVGRDGYAIIVIHTYRIACDGFGTNVTLTIVLWDFLAHAKCNIFAFPSDELRENRTAFFNESQNENDVFSERAFVIISNGVCSGRREMPFGPQTRYSLKKRRSEKSSANQFCFSFTLVDDCVVYILSRFLLSCFVLSLHSCPLSLKCLAICVPLIAFAQRSHHHYNN